MIINPKQLLAILVGQGAIQQQEASQFEIDALKKDIPIEQYLFKKTPVDKQKILEAIGKNLHIPYADITNTAIDPQALSFVQELIARKNSVIPIRYNTEDESITLVTSDPYDMALSDFLERKTGKKFVLAYGFIEDIKNAIDIAYSQSLSPEIKEALEAVESGQKLGVEKTQSTLIKEVPISKIVSSILEFAIKSRASDIHIEAE